MRAIDEPLEELEQYRELIAYLDKPFACAEVSGCIESQKLHMINGLSSEFRNRIIITYSDIRAREIYEDYAFYDRNIMVYPEKDLIFYQADVHSNEVVKQRIKTIRRLIEGKPVSVVTTFSSFMTPQIPLETIRKNIIHIDSRHSVDEKDIAHRLIGTGYEKVYQVEAPGQFSIRGDIIDVFDLTEDNPYRIELWGDDVQSIRSFDIESQRSLEKLQSIEIFPASEMALSQSELEDGIAEIEKDVDSIYASLRKEFRTEEAAHLRDSFAQLKERTLQFGDMSGLDCYMRYFYKEPVSFIDLFKRGETCIFIDEPGHVLEHADAVLSEFRESMIHRSEKGYALPGQMNLLFSVDECLARMHNGRTVCIDTLPFSDKDKRFDIEKHYDVKVRSISPYNNIFEQLVKDLKNYRKNGYKVIILSGSRTRAKRIVSDLADNDLNSFYSEDPGRVLQPGEVMTYYGRILKGFEYPELKFAVISESDIFSEHKKKKRSKKKKYNGEKISDFANLKIGDYVVHEDHGLGVYKGIEKIKTDNVIKDYIRIQYGDGGNLYVLATGLNVIQKYSSGGDNSVHKPKLNKLGGSDWSRTKSRVRNAVEEVAQDLVELYAKRQQAHGFRFSRDSVWQQEFEDAFPYQETEDQEDAILSTKKDMESGTVMDRLICGDVGFGKTEVAIRAAFKAVQDGKQVALLVPTTILAQQHYNTFVSRMKDFPVRVDMLSRFRTEREQRKTITDLRKGLVDIVIGTHRLLSADVVYKDLGLLVVDEEQRFGVTHKEKLKKLKENVDVLTLSATPIPRTLHMSLVGIRDMSVLEEAPNDRQPIQTFVCEYNDEMVREAIVREISRNGQVYYVYNRVNDIADIAAQLQKLVPEANVAFAHGQMNENELEKIMYDFIDGEIDVLVSTTIIETGLDIPNVNTMIIHDSDQMGLSQLYQLRGRVGRSNRTAYAFLMYKKNKMLKEVAEKRLSAIREFTDLGSGFKIAMRDLEIRGAGTMLGQKQSGHMEAVGYDMYCKMLNEAVTKLKRKGEKLQELPETTVDLDADAYIPGNYILNEDQKLEIYKRIAGIENKGEYSDMKDELKDRFGDIPESVDNLLRISLVRSRAQKLYINEIKGNRVEISFSIDKNAPVKIKEIERFMQKFGGRMSFHGKARPLFIYNYSASEKSEASGPELIEDTEKILDVMQENFK